MVEAERDKAIRAKLNSEVQLVVETRKLQAQMRVIDNSRKKAESELKSLKQQSNVNNHVHNRRSETACLSPLGYASLSIIEKVTQLIVQQNPIDASQYDITSLKFGLFMC
jgi:hypothetical protein